MIFVRQSDVLYKYSTSDLRKNKNRRSKEKFSQHTKRIQSGDAKHPYSQKPAVWAGRRVSSSMFCRRGVFRAIQRTNRHMSRFVLPASVAGCHGEARDNGGRSISGPSYPVERSPSHPAFSVARLILSVPRLFLFSFPPSLSLSSLARP